MMSTRLSQRPLARAALSAALLLGCLSATALTVGPAAASPTAAAATTFDDEFNGPAGSGVDGSKWNMEVGDNVNNHEQEYYTSGTNNAAMDGQGHLVITAKREGGHNCWYGPCLYTSARLNTSGHFSQTYGHFEASIKMSQGQGMWPAFWMLGGGNWPTDGEVDIMENIGREPNTVHGTIHGPGYSGANGIGAAYNGPRFADGFHVFAVDWSPNQIKWSVDGNVYETRTPADLGGNRWVYDHPFFMILNLAVGGDWPGNADGSTPMPNTMVVDYVRVTDTSGGGGGGGGSTGSINGLAGKCADVAGANSANGTPVNLYDCNGTAAQQWTHNGNAFQALGKCLDVSNGGTANGTPVQLWDCNGSGAQQWAYNSSSHDIVNLQANKCLDVTGNNSANGTRLQIWDCAGTANQKWNAPA
jgi:beta-glucanase (GH16 family)